ncbi:MAG: dCTP deaminase [bacterium]
MATWSDADILAAVQAGTLEALPWHPEDLTPNGLDLRIGHVLVPSVSSEPVAAGKVQVPPMTRFVVGTEAVLRMPPDVVGSLWIRSSFARRGVLASFGKVDAGFRGNLTLGAFHAGHEPLEITVGDRFCQVVFEPLASPPRKPYAGAYQDQRGVTLAPRAKP